MAKSNALKMKLPSVDDLFSTEESRQEAKLTKIYDIPISEIDDFPDHPYRVLDDEDRRLFVINKNLIEQKYGVSVAEDDVRWFIDGVEVTTGYYYSRSDGNPVPEGTRVQAIITIPKGSLEDNPNCCTIITNYSD